MNATTEADSQGELEAFVEYYANTLTFNYADLAVFAVLLFEYLTTFDREVQFAWGRKSSWARTIFLLNRYLSIVEYLVVLGPLLPTVNYFRMTHSLPVAFAGLRVYAISARSRVVTMIVVLLAVVPAVTNAYVASLTSIVLSDLGCMSGMDLSLLTWIEFVLILFTWGTMHVARTLHVQMSFTLLILREGVLYFGVMLSLNIVQISFDFLQVGSFSFIVPFLNVIIPILISRFFLDLDDLKVQESPGRSYSSATELRYLGTQSTMHF
ncbi:hypothetical protein C8T65DRAFT_556597, partial [Cerioporus squamosus]